jgi:hypothetical protein
MEEPPFFLGIGWGDRNPLPFAYIIGRFSPKGQGYGENWESIQRCQNIQKSDIQIDTEFYGGH